jgi:hypothetical protein
MAGKKQGKAHAYREKLRKAVKAMKRAAKEQRRKGHAAQVVNAQKQAES